MPASDSVLSFVARAGDAPADLRDPRYQQKVVRAMSREWGPHLSYREYRMLAFIIDHTICWARTTYRFTYRCFEEGTTVSAGIGIKETQAREDLKALAGKGFIAVKRMQNGLEITPDPEWKPADAPVPKPIAANRASETGASDPLEPEGLTLRNRSPLLEEQLEDQDRGTTGAIGFAGTAPVEEEPASPIIREPQIAAPSQVRQRPVRPVTNVDDVQRQFDLGDATRVSTAGAPDQHKAPVAAAKLKAQRELKNAGAVWSTWEAAWNEVYAGNAGASLVAWTKVQNGILNKTVIAKWKGDAASLHEFIDWTVREWAMIRVTEFGWMKRDPAPLTPSLKFFLAFHHRFASLFNRREVDRALSGLSAQERIKREMMLKRGASAEEADREIAKGKARAELRDEIEEGVRRARQIEREAAVTQANTEKLNREHLRKVQRIAQRQPAAPPEPMRYLSPEELQQALQQVSNFTVEPFDESR